MTLIKSVSVYTHCNDLEGKVWNPAIHWTLKYAVFVVLEDEHGEQGMGECWCFDSAPDALVAFLRTEVARHFTGIELTAIEEVSSRLLTRATLTARHGILASALSGLDIAAWDLRSRLADRPLFNYLDAKALNSVALYASGGLYAKNKTRSDLGNEMQTFTRNGFSIVKMKVGALSLAQDIDRVLAVLEALPAATKLIIDGVYSYTREQAMNLYSQLPAERIEAFQAPVVAADIAAMHSMIQAGVPVMVAEAEYREEVHRELIEREAVAFLQCSPIACGGITRLQSLSERLSGSTIRLSLEVSSTAVALMAACQFAAAHSTVAHVEWHSVHTVFYDELNLQPIAESMGRFKLPTRSGLGISVDRASLKAEFTLGD